ncbi:hypothetical protein GGP41_009634 [Bipolaris sorokiniana]|uniref:Zn(2)-C6 fungal-type domain-containing protein n=2 Tax=Cochliobolus sativus TaxID=45130 RepID=A0A8H5ZAG4_COCSA|nr:uncharacterized protein COCSADRAFT_346845 [Bipolaris sorokiniana ND90Pr]EMD60244.1 hypothetical protein COCSADRAFT_346845 [Bipolaris sorokiniana ND90Pr]KAF5845770.1 hypothetical protein GGP41_009634 [Bipolaris sorokiniana]
MQDQDQYADVDNELRLKEISRRSACDRCRRMKTRCDRGSNWDLVQLQQCRRCWQARVKCITTMEGQQHLNRPSDEPTHRHWKQFRTPSYASSSSYQGSEVAQEAVGQHSNTSAEQSRGQFTADVPPSYPMVADTTSDCDIWSTYDIDHSWRDLGEGLSQEGNSTHTRLTTISPANRTLQNPTPSIDMTDSFTNVQSLLAATHFNHTSQECRDLFLHDSSMPMDSESLDQTIMSELMKFNNRVLLDLQDSTEASQHTTSSKSVLVKTFQHSIIFTELLARIRQAGDISEGSSSGSESAEPRYGCSASEPYSKVDTDLALQLLSCNMNVNNMYKRLYMELRTRSWEIGNAHVLPTLSLEGLQSLDVVMRNQVLLHVCLLNFGKIKSEFEVIRSRGYLTPTAEKTFQIVIGASRNRAMSDGLGIEQSLENFRQMLVDGGVMSL